MSIDRRPAAASAMLALVAAVGAVLTVGGASTLTLLVAITGAVTVAAALIARSRTWLTVGAFVLFASVVIGGLVGAASLYVLGGAVATLLTWDLGENALGLGEQVGRAATTSRVELVHAAGAVGVGVAAAAVALGATTAAGPVPLSALVAALLAGVLLLIGLRL